MLRAFTLVLLVACDSSTPAAIEEPTQPETRAVNVMNDNVENNVDDNVSDEVNIEGEVVVRFVLDRDSIPANVAMATHAEARVTGKLYVFNGSTTTQTLDFETPASFELTWTFTREDGAVFVPTFLPPPMPPPGGRPQTHLELRAGKEEAVANLGGISGFYRQGEAINTFGPLSPGRYEVRVAGVRLGPSGTFDAAPVVLTAR
ncbi:MAG: hypothetical protein AB8H86_10300 [Polyangiales bacterium]